MSKEIKSVFTPRIASEVFDTSIMKTEEVVLFVKSAIKNGVELETAYNDMRVIDKLLHVEKLHIAVHGSIKRTERGYVRKGTSLYDSLNSIIDTYINENQKIN